MLSFTLKTWREATPAEPYSFYVLNKGNNCGKPAYKPWRNCFMLTAEDSAESEFYYWLTYCSWLTKRFEPYLRGSVIPFITIHHVKEVILESSRHAIIDPNHAKKLLSTMRNLDLVEKHQIEIAYLCKDAKKSAAWEYIRKKPMQAKIPLV